MLPEKIELEIVTPERFLLSELVQSVELPGKEGYLGVLPGHAPLLTELGVGTLSYAKEGATKYLAITKGYAEVLPGRVIVLADVAERAEEIDVPRARAAADHARAELAKSPSPEEYARASFDLDRALARLNAASKTGIVSATESASH